MSKEDGAESKIQNAMIANTSNLTVIEHSNADLRLSTESNKSKGGILGRFMKNFAVGSTSRKFKK